MECDTIDTCINNTNDFFSYRKALILQFNDLLIIK